MGEHRPAGERGEVVSSCWAQITDRSRAPTVSAVPRDGCGATVWLTGLPGAGKSTLAYTLARELADEGTAAHVLDGEVLRQGLTSDLGFSREHRGENARRVAHIALILAEAGVVALVALVSPYAADRQRARALHEEAGSAFVEVWVDTPLAICELRDPKGMYRRARRGELPELTGVDAPYEAALEADVRLRLPSLSKSVETVRAELSARGVARRSAEAGSGSAGLDNSPEVMLTLREREVLGLMELGLTNKEIANRLSIKLATVKNHVHNILDKLKADRRGKAVALARSRPQTLRRA
jgi:adenylyl-sulfate kinase